MFFSNHWVQTQLDPARSQYSQYSSFGSKPIQNIQTQFESRIFDDFLESNPVKQLIFDSPIKISILNPVNLPLLINLPFFSMKSSEIPIVFPTVDPC